MLGASIGGILQLKFSGQGKYYAIVMACMLLISLFFLLLPEGGTN
jgi:hypothetical protein